MYFLTVLEVGKSKMTVLANSAPDGDLLSGFQTAAFLLGPHLAFPQSTCVDREREREIASSSYKGTSPLGLRSHSYDLI